MKIFATLALCFLAFGLPNGSVARTIDFSGAHIPLSVLEVDSVKTARDTDIFTSSGTERADWSSTFGVGETRSWIELVVSPYGSDPLLQNLAAELELEVLVRSATDPSVNRTETITLSADYDVNPGTQYQERSIYKANSSQFLRARVVASLVTDESGELVSDDKLLDRFALQLRMEEERYVRPNVRTAPAVIVRPEINLEQGEITLTWGELPWAEHYELEWTYVNDYDAHGTPAARPASELSYDFRFQSTRVPVSGASYTLPLIFERGYLLWRVRGVGRSGADFSQPVPGRWSAFEAGTGTGIPSASRTVIAIEPGMVHAVNPRHGGASLHWQHIATYAEAGKRKDVLAYMDGSQRARQKVTKINSNNLPIVQETIYDHRGHEAIQVLPAPVPNEEGQSMALGFREDFNRNARGKPYSYRNFERQDASGCQPPTAAPMQSAHNGAARYFSADNPDKAAHQAYLPDAQGYPFSQTVYTPDSTGRPTLQSGLGRQLRVASGHTARYHYGVPGQQELDRLFGTDVGYARHYKKRVYTDPDGQDHVEYTDSGGRVIATALAGNNPASLLPTPDTDYVVPLRLDLLQGGEQRDATDPLALTSSKTIIVTNNATPYDISYRFTPPDLTDETCTERSFCFDCVYDLDIKLVNSCGEVIASHESKIGSLAQLGACTDDAPESVDLQLHPLGDDAAETASPVVLDRGSYRVIRTLRVDEAQLEKYVDHYAANNSCLPALRDRQRSRLAPDYDPAACEGECTTCSLDAIPSSVTIDADPGGPRTVEFDVEQRRELDDDCSRGCGIEPEAMACQAGHTMMLTDVTPEGEYGTYTRSSEGVAFADDQPLSVFNHTASNRLPAADAHWKNPLGLIDSVLRPDGYPRASAYRDPDGSPARVPIPGGDRDFCEAGSPEISEGVCFPEHINRLDDFLTHWEVSWAEALVGYHPEYGYYTWCNQPEPTRWSRYDLDLRALDTFAAAEAADLADPFSDDPFLADSATRDARRAVIDRISLPDGTANLLQATRLIVHCANPNFTAEQLRECIGESDDFTLGHSAEFADDEWRIFRDLYRSRRASAIYAYRKREVQRDWGYVNDCINSEDPTRCPKPINIADYRDKQKRFPSNTDALALSRGGDFSRTVDYVQRKMYETCGKCPLALQLETLLSAVASKQKLGERFQFPYFPIVPTRALLDSFADSRALRYQWRGDVSDNRLTVGISSEAGEQCRIGLEKEETAIPWQGFKRFKGLSPANRVTAGAVQEFSVKGVLEDNTLANLSGTVSCIRFDRCDFSRQCVASTDVAGAFSDLVQRVFAIGAHTGGGYLLHDPERGSPTLPTSLLEGVTRPNKPVFWEFQHWGSSYADTSNRRRFSATIINGDNNIEFSDQLCALDIEMLTPGKVFPDGPLTILGVSDTYVDSLERQTSCSTPDIELNAELANGTPVKIRVSSDCYVFGDCCVKPANCPVLANSSDEGREPTRPEDIGGLLGRAGGLIPGNAIPDDVIDPDLAGVLGVLNPPRLNNLPGCDSCCYPPTGTVPYENPCPAQREARLEWETERWYADVLDAERRRIRADYLRKCLDTQESFFADVSENIYHFTLFYYDQAGNLIRTVPPKGVIPLAASELASVARQRSYDSDTAVIPSHSMPTIYTHNTFNSVVTEDTPDSGTSRTWYDRLGRPRFAQTAFQADVTESHDGRLVSFIEYDAIGRMTASGEMMTSTAPPNNEEFWKEDSRVTDWLEDNTINDVVQSKYDIADATPSVAEMFDDGQNHLRNRISSQTRITRKDDGSQWKQASYYTYDVAGNIERFVQFYADMPESHRYKTIDYEYDLISGNLKQRRYQSGKPDQFTHRYAYDADNRLLEASTSANMLVWDNDASYLYYDHGPVSRFELGEEKIQGIDYAYTLTGALKSMNSDSGIPLRDIGKDGLNSAGQPNRSIPPDAFGFSLSYFYNDYLPIDSIPATLSFYGDITGSPLENQSLYDGNIRNAIMSNQAFGEAERTHAEGYRYDVLRRLRISATVQGLSKANNSWVASRITDKHATSYTYDANGNFELVARNASDGSAIDNLSYAYNENTNQLDHVADTIGKVGRDIGNQSLNNHAYDASGRITQDVLAGASKIQWTATEKLKSVEEESGNSEFKYDTADRRAVRIGEGNSEWTVRDASGKILAIYEQENNDVVWKASPIYAQNRIGGISQPVAQLAEDTIEVVRGNKLYELVNQVGSVSSLVVDRKIPVDGTDSIYDTDIALGQQYYPFGMVKNQVVSSTDRYRFTFQGMELNKSTFGTDDTFTTEFRQYSAISGRWLTLDPISRKYPSASPYIGMGNRPVSSRDPSGLDPGLSCSDCNFVQSLNADEEEIYFNATRDRDSENFDTPIELSGHVVTPSRSFTGSLIGAGAAQQFRENPGTEVADIIAHTGAYAAGAGVAATAVTAAIEVGVPIVTLDAMRRIHTLFRGMGFAVGLQETYDLQSDISYQEFRAENPNTPVLFIEAGLIDPTEESGLGFHQSIGVGIPGEAETFSFGLVDPISLTGQVYLDTSASGAVRRWVPVRQSQVPQINAILRNQDGNQDTYTPCNQCRTWTDEQWQNIIERFQIDD